MRAGYPEGPDSLVIFDDVFSKEPLTPAVVDGDTAWAQAVEWAIFATIQAEELGVTKSSVQADASGTDAAKVLFLGGKNADGTTLDPGPRPAGRTSRPRSSARSATTARSSRPTWRRSASPSAGLNALWSDGGLQYAPPYR